MKGTAMRYFLYKTFSWTVIILTALFGTFATGFVLGAVGMAKIHEKESDEAATPGPILS